MSPQSYHVHAKRVRRLRHFARAARIARWVALANGVAGVSIGIAMIQTDRGAGISTIGWGITLGIYWFVFTKQAEGITESAESLSRDMRHMHVRLTVDTSGFLEGLRAARTDMGEDDKGDEVERP